MTARVPFAERGGAVRGVLDLVTGCYPAFLFGRSSVGEELPVFHLHEVTRDWLEPRVRYLAENGYRTVACDEIARYVIAGVVPGPKTIALTFDDAWENTYDVAFPLLKQYGFRAVLYAIPARVGQAGFMTWAQLRELSESGVFDVQSHTLTHAMIFSDADVVDFVTPDFDREPLLNRPLEANGLGTPLYQRRSRMSDALRFHADERAAERCRERVAELGGLEFFRAPTWRHELISALGRPEGRFEDDRERTDAITDELASGRALLNEGLRTNSVRHVALPWGVSGAISRRAVEATGHELAFAERPWQRRSVRAGDDRFHLMRLNGKFLTCLPGRGRDTFFAMVR